MDTRRSNCIHTRENGRLASTTTADIDALVAGLKDRPRVVLHFHGGLVDDALGFATAARLTPVYEAAGVTPVFFVWSSGLLETVRGNLPKILSESVFRTLLNRVTRYAAGLVFAQPGRRSLGTVPTPPARAVAAELSLAERGQEPYGQLVAPHEVEQLSEAERARITAELDADTELALRNREIVNSAYQDPASTAPEGPPEQAAARGVTGGRAAAATLMSPATVEELTVATVAADVERAVVTSALLVRKAVRVVGAVVGRFRAHSDHGLYPTVVEEILREFYVANVGAAIWDAMKQQTAATFAAPALPGEVRAGRYFMDRFGELLGAGPRPRLSVVGHSAGAVFIDNLLTDLDRRRTAAEEPVPADFRVRDVVLLAPACTVAHLAPVVRRRAELFDRFRMFTMTDTAERADHLVPHLYPRSLLYFVSGVLERDPDGRSAVLPLAGMQRAYSDGAGGAGQDIAAVRDFLDADATRTVWSPHDGGPGLSSGAHSHSGFDDDPEVLASVAAMLAE
ncbi:hypothetical protein [Streptomyces sp. NPDC059009]|uniref:hypothetical protein n=1 Tax=Streptomyces sp. NPDC059009 TaxID=3346694 RepID=UPI0036BFC982